MNIRQTIYSLLFLCIIIDILLAGTLLERLYSSNLSFPFNIFLIIIFCTIFLGLLIIELYLFVFIDLFLSTHEKLIANQDKEELMKREQLTNEKYEQLMKKVNNSFKIEPREELYQKGLLSGEYEERID